LENERRSRVRHIFELQPEATLFLTVDGHPVPVLELQDISPFGIGLLIDGRVNNGFEVGLRYIDGASNKEVFGSVVWNSIAESESHESSVGIYFREQDVAANVAFFNAVTA